MSSKETPEERRIREIKLLHEEMLTYGRRSLEKALRIGELLTEQKKQIAHGNFMEWVKNNLPFISHATATAWMRLYDQRNDPKLQTVSKLNTAYKLLRGGPPELDDKGKGKGKDKGKGKADAPGCKEYPLKLTKLEDKDFNKLTSKLLEVFPKSKSAKDADPIKLVILSALRFAYKELVNAKDYPNLNGLERRMGHKANGKAGGRAPLPNRRKRRVA